MTILCSKSSRLVGNACPHCGMVTITDYGQSTRSYPSVGEAMEAVFQRLGKIDRLSMKRVTSATITLDDGARANVTYYLTAVDDDKTFCEV